MPPTWPSVWGCCSFIEAAQPEHPSLIDAHHVLAELFGVINIPQSVWVDEQGMIVRPAETAPAPPGAAREPRIPPDGQVPERFKAIMGEAQKIRQDAEPYHEALRDWVEHGAASRYALSPEAGAAHRRSAGPLLAGPAAGCTTSLAVRRRLAGRHPRGRGGKLLRALAALSRARRAACAG